MVADHYGSLNNFFFNFNFGRQISVAIATPTAVDTKKDFGTLKLNRKKVLKYDYKHYILS